MPEYLVIFAQFHMDFRLPELESLAVLEGVELVYDRASYTDDHPFLIVNLKSDEDAQRLIRRSILIKEVVRLYADEKTFEDLLDVVRDTKEIHGPYQNSSFRFDVRAFGHTLSQEEQVERIELFCFLPCGAVKIKNPDVVFTYIEDYGTVFTRGHYRPEKPFRVLFGVLVAKGDRGLIHTYDLKKRKYLGTTSMDAELSLVMANQALARPGSFILDPFVGTGSFLITCAHYGAFTMGSDIDGRQIRGKGDRNIESNAVQYKLTNRVLDTLVADLAHHPWRQQPFWDAIVCDPPYGVRAGAKKLGRGQKSKVPPGPLEPKKPNGEQRYPQTVPYEMHDVIVDLIDFAGVHLVPGGRLVYWLPTITDEYTPEDIPTHPKFRLIANSAQIFGTWCRRLITMEKLHDEPSDKEAAQGAEALSASPAHAKFRSTYFKEAQGKLEQLKLSE
ncbi:hypothetical protein PhCBS80983_g00032 [Powellomyces hirtus]|uniref:tRNA (guanine(10)-N(2))-methyltransferase n=1 Tax=Powellomyces hirtus TaxID=109895 RepID=A0A507EHM2_9FUNG|nr:hypothetical protein PhCBS80983_g00032 [Powellomyces hirtus]